MTEGVRELTPTEIEDLAAGAWILGAGGGGNPYHSLLTLRAEASRGFRPVVIPASALADDDLVAVVSTMGAPRRRGRPNCSTSPKAPTERQVDASVSGGRTARRDGRCFACSPRHPCRTLI